MDYVLAEQLLAAPRSITPAGERQALWTGDARDRADYGTRWWIWPAPWSGLRARADHARGQGISSPVMTGPHSCWTSGSRIQYSPRWATSHLRDDSTMTIADLPDPLRRSPSTPAAGGIRHVVAELGEHISSRRSPVDGTFPFQQTVACRSSDAHGHGSEFVQRAVEVYVSRSSPTSSHAGRRLRRRDDDRHYSGNEDVHGRPFPQFVAPASSARRPPPARAVSSSSTPTATSGRS